MTVARSGDDRSGKAAGKARAYQGSAARRTKTASSRPASPISSGSVPKSGTRAWDSSRSRWGLAQVSVGK